MNRLRDLREARDMTLADVAKLIGSSSNSISNYERGNRSLTPDLINKFCDLYGVTSDYLLGLSDHPHPALSDSDAEFLNAYYAAPEEIRDIVDAALAPYDQEVQNKRGIIIDFRTGRPIPGRPY